MLIIREGKKKIDKYKRTLEDGIHEKTRKYKKEDGTFSEYVYLYQRVRRSPEEIEELKQRKAQGETIKKNIWWVDKYINSDEERIKAEIETLDDLNKFKEFENKLTYQEKDVFVSEKDYKDLLKFIPELKSCSIINLQDLNS